VKPGRVRIGSVGVDNLSWGEALDRVEELVSGRGGGYAVALNIDQVVTAEQDEEFRRIVLEADLVIADGQPLVWFSRLLGRPLPEKVTGSDFLTRFAPRGAARGFRVFLLGGREGAAASTARILSETFPGYQVAGICCPPLGFERDPEKNREVIERIKTSRPDIVFIGLGAPKQEKWIAHNRKEYAPAFSFPVGAGFDFLSGQVRRAPAWLGRAGLEWAWRLAGEPRRMFGRYIVRDSRFLPIAIRQMRHDRIRR
jgi:N-acetylglucosaminyldiphosphoundecaprenol N-acetyl-beta-D-mannosaminyltransferase